MGFAKRKASRFWTISPQRRLSEAVAQLLEWHGHSDLLQGVGGEA